MHPSLFYGHVCLKKLPIAFSEAMDSKLHNMVSIQELKHKKQLRFHAFCLEKCFPEVLEMSLKNTEAQIFKNAQSIVLK